ncbi:alpha/beta fold hydrolase [Haloglomus halophilum]|uniref:alpha/beta fold hydrolase n=1 Tax=Haloglomus halophilum TaxID=2962672 RepID=UPI0020C9426B|nr:alpha/beta hydrolase [Haloglomus halophilum]
MPSNTHAAAETNRCDRPDGRTLTYAVAGDPGGVPVVAHHGTPGSRLFAALLAEPARERGIRLLVPDRPGFGGSDPPSPDYRPGTILRPLLDAESLDSAPVLAFSGGGTAALAAARDDQVTRVALVAGAVPDAESPLDSLARVPFGLRALFRVSGAVARLRGPEAVVGQYTDRDVPERVAERVAADFHEGLRQGARATAREFRRDDAAIVDAGAVDVPLRAWHGRHDENVPLEPVRAFVTAADGELTVLDADHLGTLLDARADALEWLASG